MAQAAKKAKRGNATGGGRFRFAIDRGGTFTDIYAEQPDGSVRVMKLLSVDPAYADAPREGIRRILEEFTGKPHPVDQPIDISMIESIRMGTTVATNALLERKGEPIALAITRGFRDLLHIGNQSRPKIFDLTVAAPDVLYDQVIEISERLVLNAEGKVTGATGERLNVREPVDLDSARQGLQRAYDSGIRSLAIVLLHSYLHDAHERALGRLAEEIGFTHVSLSSEVMQMAKVVPRGFTACADAYLTPCIKRYVEGFASGFANSLEGVQVLFMRSDGGLTPMDRFAGSQAIVSGPAGGVVGYALTAYDPETRVPAIGFDMGGTSTDVSRFGGTFDHVFETTVGGVTIQAPQLDINTVAAGGGSQLFFRAGMFVVGPESAGAHPGPVCYRKGGPLTVTDANLLLGRIRAEDFPNIFGKTNDQPLDAEATRAAFEVQTAEINAFLAEQAAADGKPAPTAMTPADVALGFLDVANEAMCRPIRAITQARGFNASDHVLACFGGAGGQHACAIARSLDMVRIHISKYSGILSAYGIAAADVVQEEQTPCAAQYTEETRSALVKQLMDLVDTGIARLQEQGFTEDTTYAQLFLNMRYKGTDCALMVNTDELPLAEIKSIDPAHFGTAFEARYRREFGFFIPDRDVLVDDLRVRLVGKTKPVLVQAPPKATTKSPPVHSHHDIVFGASGATSTPVYSFGDFQLGHEVPGPALLTADTSTILVEPGCTARLTSSGDLEIVIGEGRPRRISTALDVVHLSVFQHRFMTIAEQMGRALQRTAISTNIKERLDFSCALFSPDGGLVANAPHIPVHLGAMQEAVRYQIEIVGDDLENGDVLLSNHPAAGGSHLPDITVITPVFRDGHKKPLFWVASRGHHADIGGITPGSMPPKSVTLEEEGAAIKSFKIVRHGQFQEQGITDLLMEPAKYPGCSGTRNLSDNLSDLKAQVAANQRGIALVTELMDEMGVDVVVAYMQYIQENAEFAVRGMLKEAGRRAREATGESVLRCTDYLDDGSPITLCVTIDEANGTAHFDFTGTGPQVYGNLNTPRAVAYSGVIYCLRCMVGHDIPLNQGCLKPVTIEIPHGSLLWPSDDAAVVGGNVLTSQRVCDVILKAFGACADSQGCMNNVTFGNATVGYYETVCGGAGAGPTWDGRSGVHTHMTNTRITDVEVLERRYPVTTEAFQLRKGSGGVGRHPGGDGVLRELAFHEPMTVSVLCERRSFRPRGLAGGGDAQPGVTHLVRASGLVINLGAKATVTVSPGDRLRLLTPGGGGYGAVEELDHVAAATK